MATYQATKWVHGQDRADEYNAIVSKQSERSEAILRELADDTKALLAETKEMNAKAPGSQTLSTPDRE